MTKLLLRIRRKEIQIQYLLDIVTRSAKDRSLRAEKKNERGKIFDTNIVACGKDIMTMNNPITERPGYQGIRKEQHFT